jgi:copper chaperone NosL
MMQKSSRLLIALSAVLLVPAFTLPLWSVRIVAPQYNDGLGMFIGLRDIWGHTQHDITNINILNHYIGMKPIDPASVGVLTIMPWVVGFLMVAALVIAAIGRRWLVASWLVAFVVLGSAGLYEFYSWNYDYGHNLSPTAPIKIPGMTYQPPLFGTKQLLNMTTSSYPSWGTLFIALAFATGALALWHDHRRRSEGRSNARPRQLAAAAALVLLTGAVMGCSPKQSAEASAIPEFAPGSPPCAYCDGTIPDTRFGAELVLQSGETHRFMGVECMVGYLLEKGVPAEAVRSARVIDYNHGERLIDAASAKYVRMAFEKTPGGLNLAAVESEKVAGTLHYFHGGERMEWPRVLEYVRAEWDL